MMARNVGRERTASDYRALLESEGFRDVRYQYVEGGQHFDVITTRKA
jgi:hypothetical protein